MLKIRLQRFGKKHQPTFRVVLTESQNSTKSGKFLEVLGWRDPRAHKHEFKKERVLHWLSHGAQASGSVHNLLVNEGIVKSSKVDVSPKKKKKLEDSREAESAAAEGAEEPATKGKTANNDGGKVGKESSGEEDTAQEEKKEKEAQNVEEEKTEKEKTAEDPKKETEQASENTEEGSKEKP